MSFRACILLAALLCALPCSSQSAPASTRDQCDQQFGVRIGNAGKDVIWVPTHDTLVTAMLEAAQITSQDFVIDLGAGDGKIPIAAAKQFGARALGIEYDPAMVQLARCYADAEGVADKVEIRQADIFQTDLSDADVVTLYLLPKLNRQLRPKLLALEPGTRIVSNRFKMGPWQPDRDIIIEGMMNPAYLWIVPERVAGLWEFSDNTGARRFRLRIAQQFQRISATMPGTMRRAQKARLQGRRIELVVSLGNDELRLNGEVNGPEMRLRAENEDGVSFIGRRQ
jgi:hypothetical protein